MNLSQALEVVEGLRPGFRQELQGASVEEIKAVEVLAGGKMPRDQLELLSVMGSCRPSVFRGFMGTDMRAETLSRFYATEGWRPDASMTVVGCDPGGTPLTVLRHEPGRHNPRVAHLRVAGLFGEWARPEEYPPDPLADSLGALLVTCAYFNFVAYEYEHELYSEVLEPRPDDRERIDRALVELGFARDKVEVPTHSFYRHASAFAICSQLDEDESVLVYGFADDAAQLERIAGVVGRRVELKVNHIWPVAYILDPLDDEDEDEEEDDEDEDDDGADDDRSESEDEDEDEDEDDEDEDDDDKDDDNVAADNDEDDDED